jgi:hypothetical protein
MKRKESNEPDLYVDSRKLTAKDRKEISDFIAAYKLKQKNKKPSPRKAA